jgi:hypothetical protein
VLDDVVNDVIEEAEIVVPWHAEHVTDPDLDESVKDVLGFDSHLASIVDADSVLVCKATVYNMVDPSGELPQNVHKTGTESGSIVDA